MRRLVAAVFVILAVWLFLVGAHLWSLAATLVGLAVTAMLELRERERAAERRR